MSLSIGINLPELTSVTSHTLWLASAVAFVFYSAACLVDHPLARLRWVGGLGWLAHGSAIALDIGGVGSALPGARFGFATALSATSWVVLLIYAFERELWPSSGKLLAALGALAVALACFFPGEFRPQASSPWEPAHWALGLASYGLFGSALLHAVLLDRAERRWRSQPALALSGPPLLKLERLMFQFVGAGFALLSLTLVLGWWFAQPWHWDHKTVFSLLAWSVFAAMLMGRAQFGWRGRSAISWLYVGTLMLLLAYVGSRFVFEVVLKRIPNG